LLVLFDFKKKILQINYPSSHLIRQNNIKYFALADKTSSKVLISLTKMGLPDYSKWYTGKAETLKQWATGEPAQKTSEDCVAFQ
jgi:hypothetical protein